METKYLKSMFVLMVYIMDTRLFVEIIVLVKNNLD